VKNAIGGTNRPRLLALSLAADSDKPWIPIPELVADDKLFDSEQVQLAYAESWLLVHYLLRSRSRLPRLRDYLAGTVATPQGNLQARVKDAERHLGKLERLDREVKDWAARLHEG
jgi:hypothetical protein